MMIGTAIFEDSITYTHVVDFTGLPNACPSDCKPDGGFLPRCSKKSEQCPCLSYSLKLLFESTPKSSFAALKRNSKVVKALPASFYDQYLSKAAKEKLPSPASPYTNI